MNEEKRIVDGTHRYKVNARHCSLFVRSFVSFVREWRGDEREVERERETRERKRDE